MDSPKLQIRRILYIAVFIISVISFISICCCILPLFTLALGVYENSYYSKYDCFVINKIINTDIGRISWYVEYGKYNNWIIKNNLNDNKLEKLDQKYLINQTYTCYWNWNERRTTWENYNPDPVGTGLLSLSVGFFALLCICIPVFWLFFSIKYRSWLGIQLNKVLYEEFKDETTQMA